MAIEIEYQKLFQLYMENKTNLDGIKTLHSDLLSSWQGEYDPKEVAIYWRKWKQFKESIVKKKKERKVMARKKIKRIKKKKFIQV